MTDQNHDEQLINNEETVTAEETTPEVEIEESTVAEEEVEEAEVVSEEEPKVDAESTSSSSSADEQATKPAEPVKEEAKDTTDWKDAYLRIRADFDNYRKRTAKEFDDVRKREREKVITTWLDVYDNTERAIAALPEKEGVWYDGFQQILKQMDACLASFNIKAVDDTNAIFDAKRHEAIAILPNPALPNNTIMAVERKGFVYENGDVCRVARVIVVRNPS